MTTIATRPVTSHARGTALIVFSSCFFGTSGVLAKAAMDAGMSPEQVAGVRICLAAVLLLVGTAIFRPHSLRIRRREWPLLAVYGLVGVALVQVFYFVAVSRLPIGVAMLLEYLSPVLVTLWVRFVRQVRLARTMWLGVGLALAGLILVARVWDGLSLDTVGLLAGLATAASSATYFLVGERGVATSDPLGMTTWGLTIGAVAMIVIAPPWSVPGRLLGNAVPFGPIDVRLWQILVAIAVVSTVIAYVAGMAALRHLPSNVCAVLSLLEPVVATGLAWALLGQALSPMQLAGGAVLLTGAVIVQVTSRSTTTRESATRESLSARSWAAADTSPPPTGRPPVAPPARSGGYP